MKLSDHAARAATLAAAILPEGEALRAAVAAGESRPVVKILRTYRGAPVVGEPALRPRDNSREARAAFVALGIVLSDEADERAMAGLAVIVNG